METETEGKRGRPTNEERLKKVHEEARREFKRAATGSAAEVRLQCLAERRFVTVPGAQWEGKLGEQFSNKPRFEVNKTQLAIVRITDDYRNNRISVDFVPKDGTRSDPNDELADACAGRYRADTQTSVGQEATDNAFDEAVTGGMGAWRLRAKYENDTDPDDERQCIVREPIVDADACVFFDADAKLQDKSDATRCWVLTAMSPEGFAAEYGHDPVEWPPEIRHDGGFDWATPDVVYVAEYYVVEKKRELTRTYEALDGATLRVCQRRDDDGDLEWYDSDGGEVDLATLAAQGYQQKGERRVERRVVHKYLMSGAQVERDEGIIPGECIPVIVTYGKRWFVDGVERFQGHGRNAMDTQRLANMQRSKLAETAIQSSAAKPIMTGEQVKGYRELWENDPVKNFPYMLVNPIVDPATGQTIIGPVGYTKPPELPPALAALLQVVEQDLKDLLGDQQQAEVLRPNTSGKAVEITNERLDARSVIYISNMAKAAKREGEIWLAMARDVYVEPGRKLKTRTAQGEDGTIQLAVRAYDKKAGVEYTRNDFGRAKFEVTVDVGPSSSSKRAATVRAVTALRAITQDPEIGSVLESLALLNMEGEGLSDVREWVRHRLVRAGVLKPTDEEAEQMADEAAGAQPDPQGEYLRAAAQEAEATAAEKRAGTLLKVAQAGKAKADTEVALASIGRDDSAHALDVGRALHEAGKPPAVPFNPSNLK